MLEALFTPRSVAIVITAGFQETGLAGAMAERALGDTIRGSGLRLLGPSSLGLIDAATPLDASFAASRPLPGAIAFASQSGAVCIADGPRFRQVATALTKETPIVVFKSGNTLAGSRAISSHTGTLAGSATAYQTAFKQSGVIRAETMEELFDFAVAFAMQPVPAGRRVAIVTHAGGPGIIATDACGPGWSWPILPHRRSIATPSSYNER